jgi:hypothetical protein
MRRNVRWSGANAGDTIASKNKREDVQCVRF